MSVRTVVLQASASAERFIKTLGVVAAIAALIAITLLAARDMERESEPSERAIKWIVLGGGTAAIAMLAMAFVLLRIEITRHRRTQVQAERLTAELEDLYNKAPCGYHSVDENGLIVRMNDTWLGWLGYSRDEVVGKLHHADLMTPESAQLFREHWFPLFKQQGWLKEVEFEYVRKDGSTFPGSLQTSAIYGADRRYVMSRTTVFDISERRRVEDALRETNAFLDSIVENIPDMIFVKDAAELRFVRFNRAGEELLGHPRAELIGRNDYDFFPAAEADFFTAKDREVLASGGLVEIEAEQIDTRLKGRRILHTKKLPIVGNDGKPKYLLGISEDVTARKAAEDRIHALNDELQTRAAQLAAANKELESFSYSVSHDLRAPLRAVDGYARMLEEDYGPQLDDEGRRLLGVVRDASRRMGELIDDLLAFSRLGRQEPVKWPLDMTGLVREAIAKLAPESRAEVRLEPLPAADADRALLMQVWLNLIGNAMKYSGKRGDARVEIGGRQAERENIYWVRDNGVGFDMRYAGKLFGVFQRLHSADDFPGTGVGLAIVQRVVARHGGRVWAEGRPGEGAVFQFSLPAEPGA